DATEARLQHTYWVRNRRFHRALSFNKKKETEGFFGGKRTEKWLFCKTNGASARPTRPSVGAQMVRQALERLFSRMLFSVILLYIHSVKTQNFHGRHITSRRKTLTLWQ
ncbi:MAG: hypothetical protein J6I34_05200, partial [Prevotella sp.]|nr:hypothetical protein [Prevotella sp.]